MHSIPLGGLNSIFHVSINPCHEDVDVILEASSAKGVLKVSGGQLLADVIDVHDEQLWT